VKTILILGRISWNGSKWRDLEMFHRGIDVEHLVEMNYGVKMDRMVFHTDSLPPTLYLTLDFEVFMQDLPPSPYPFSSGSFCVTPSFKLRLCSYCPPPYPFASLCSDPQGCHRPGGPRQPLSVGQGHRDRKPLSSTSPFLQQSSRSICRTTISSRPGGHPRC
jgi:hypothetical protein